MDCCNFAYRGLGPYSTNRDWGYSEIPNTFRQHYENVLYYDQWAYSQSHRTDYVYNPKEARIRKAIRERERLIAGGGGICERGPPAALSPALSRNGRRSPHWAAVQHPHQMGQQPSSALGSPFGHCAPPLPLPAHQQSRMHHSVGMGMEHGGGDYVFGGVPPPYQQPAYIHLPPSDWLANSYLQNNASLHQQFWNQYHHTDRLKPHPKSIARNYIIPPEEHQYLQIEQLPNSSNMLPHNPMEVPKDMTIATSTNTAPNNTCLSSDYMGCSPLTPCSNQSEVNTPTNVIDAAASCEDHYADFSTVPTSVQSQSELMERPVDLVSGPRDTQNINHQLNEHQSIENTNDYVLYAKQKSSFDDTETRHSFKNMQKASTSRDIQDRNQKPVKSIQLPRFEQAFGGTERGRYQSAPGALSLELALSEYGVRLDDYADVADKANSATTTPPPMIYTKDFAKMPF